MSEGKPQDYKKRLSQELTNSVLFRDDPSGGAYWGGESAKNQPLLRISSLWALGLSRLSSDSPIYCVTFVFYRLCFTFFFPLIFVCSHVPFFFRITRVDQTRTAVG
jgi:hypothetical protein